jgi:stage III sporulation protein AB
MLGMCAILFGGIACGVSLNKRAEHELREAESWGELFRYITEKITAFGMPVNEIIAECDSDLLERCGLLGGASLSFKERVLSREIRYKRSEKIIRSFAESFGKIDRAEQIKDCEYYTRLMENHRQTLEGKLQNQKKINLTLSVSVALAIIIILI